MALFEHMCEFRRLHSSQDEPPKFLGVAMTAEQKVIIAPTMADLMVGQILKDAGGDGATKKLAQRKLNNAGAITNHCGLQNHPSRIKKLLAALELTASLAEISALTKANKTKEKWKAGTAMMDLAPAALVKLNGKSAGIVAKLKKNEVCAISFRFFGSMLKESNPKSVLGAAWRGSLPRNPVSSLRLERLLLLVPRCPCLCRVRGARTAARRTRRRGRRTRTSRA